jgi:hypothetical protein
MHVVLERSLHILGVSPDAALSPAVLPPIGCVGAPGFEVGAIWQYQ